MGVKKGKFVSKNGHTYEVRLSGTNVGNADILLGVPPVVISMAAGEHKFCGFKSTTALVNILTDVPLIDLYASGVRDIRLTVEDKTASTVEFDGYATPFAFDQPYTGKLDSVQVNAVDLLTAFKDEKYVNVGDVHGVDVSALTIIQNICQRVGVRSIVEHVNFNRDSDAMVDASPLDVNVSQAGFLQDEMSYLDSLSAIFKFFGHTGHLVGDTLYLYDELALANGATDSTSYSYSSGQWSRTSHYYRNGGPLSPQPIASYRSDMSVSVERAYDAVQIKLEGRSVSVLMPDVCSDEYEEKNTDGRGQSPVSVNGANLNESEERLPIGSRIMEFGYDNGSGITDWGNSSAMTAPAWEAGAMLVKATAITSKIGYVPTSPGQEPRYYDWNERGDGSNKIWLRARRYADTLVGVQKNDTRYSHTGGLIELKLRYHLAQDDSKSLYAAYDGGDNFIGFVQIKVGDVYYIEDYDPMEYTRWGYDRDARMVVGDNLSLVPTIASVHYGATSFVEDLPMEALLGNGGQIGIELGWHDRGLGQVGQGVVIDSIELLGYGEDVWNEHPHLRHEFRAAPADVLEVEAILTTRASGQDLNPNMVTPAININARPSIVVGERFAANYLGTDEASDAMEICGVLMLQLRERYKFPHIAYKMTCDGYVAPYAGCSMNNNIYTVDAYDWDIYNDETTITID